jgi:hypothetical protein
VEAWCRAAIFERPVTTLGIPERRRWRHDIDHSDPELAAGRAASTGASGKAADIEAMYRPY